MVESMRQDTALDRVSWSKQSSAPHYAQNGLSAVKRASTQVNELVSRMDEQSLRAPSKLSKWTKAHVVCHLAREADGLVNLLNWAKTGIEHPMYASAADRNADIEEGTHRLPQVIKEDLVAAGDRFLIAANGLPDSAWTVELTSPAGDILATHIPWIRLTELLVHLVDLDLGIDFTGLINIAGEQLPGLMDYVVWTYQRRPDCPALRLDIELPSGEKQSWTLRDNESTSVSGAADVALAWLTGRANGAGLRGNPPKLPAWL